MTVDESWMQEICTSSLKRGRAILRQAWYAVFRHGWGNPDTRFAVTYTCPYPLSTLPADGTLARKATRGFRTTSGASQRLTTVVAGNGAEFVFRRSNPMTFTRSL